MQFIAKSLLQLNNKWNTNNKKQVGNFKYNVNLFMPWFNFSKNSRNKSTIKNWHTNTHSFNNHSIVCCLSLWEKPYRSKTCSTIQCYFHWQFHSFFIRIRIKAMHRLTELVSLKNVKKNCAIIFYSSEIYTFDWINIRINFRTLFLCNNK